MDTRSDHAYHFSCFCVEYCSTTHTNSTWYAYLYNSCLIGPCSWQNSAYNALIEDWLYYASIRFGKFKHFSAIGIATNHYLITNAQFARITPNNVWNFIRNIFGTLSRNNQYRKVNLFATSNLYCNNRLFSS
jgi:hypothetical protein